MTKVRRLLVVAAGLAVTALVSSSIIQGEPAAKKDAPLAPRVVKNAPALDDQVEQALAKSRLLNERVVAYQPLQGDNYFALQVQPALEETPVRPRDYLILVSASAAQAGVHWRAAGQMVEALIQKANAGDRISLWTVSTPDKRATRCLTRIFLSKKDDAKLLQQALGELKNKQYPAGDTDLKSALKQVMDSFDGQESRQRLIVFLGDGLSTDNLITADDRHKFCEEMVQRKIAFFSVPLGAQLSPENLHGLATGTGGTVLRTHVMEEKLEDVLARFEKAFRAPILYPSEFKLCADVTESYPSKLPPLRSDAPTLVVGRMKPAKALGYTLKGNVAGAEVTRDHQEPLAAAEPDNFFLISMVEQWKKAQTHPALIRGDRAVAIAFEQARLEHHERLLEAEFAVQENQLEAAARLFEQAKQLAPHDQEADAGLKIVANLRSGKLTRDMLRREIEKQRQVDKVEKVTANPNDPNSNKVRWTKEVLVQLAQLDKENQAKAEGGPKALEGEDLLQQQRDRNLIEEQKTTATVEANLRQARQELATDPDGAMELLRSTLLRVRDHPDLGDQVRDALLSRLQTALRDITSQARGIKLRKQEQQAIVAQVQKNRDDEKQRQTLEERTEAQFRIYKSLMNLARVEEKTKADVMSGLIAMQADYRLKGESPPAAIGAMYEEVHQGYHLRQNANLKRLREERFLSTMLAVEKSHVPFPDEPGIYFPPLSTWEAIRKLRKEKYEVSALPDDDVGRKEAKSIEALLKEQIEMKDFQNPMSLKEALQLFTDKFAGRKLDLPILVDAEAFKEENPDAPSIYDTQVQFPPYPKRMMLATALRLVLSKVSPPNATYLIRRNYIEITTIERQTRERVLRVYPVGDLVIPINAGGGMGLGGGGGLRGGMMMGGGGMMMGGMGMGGMGMMGMGGMGMGGMGMGGMGMGGMGMGGMMMGGMNMMGMGGMGMMGGGMNMMGMMGGMNMMGMMGAMGGGMMMGMMMGGGGMGMMGGGMMMGGGGMGMMGGGMMMGMMGGGMMGGGNFTGGSFMGAFNGGLGAVGAIQAPTLISTITQVVAPGEWFVTQQPQPFNQFLGGGLNNFGGVGMIGGPQLGNLGQPPPPPLAEGGPANAQDANTIQFFPPALALIVRAPSRIHTSYTGGLIGGKQKRLEAAGVARERGLDLVKAGNGNNKGGVVAGVQDVNHDDPNKALFAKVKDLDPTKIWQDALEKEGVDPVMIVATADFLFEAGKFEHAAEFLKANLRKGIVVRPWVFEALAIALEASGGAKEEIERARLSAVALDPQDSQGFLQAARTMAEHKHWDRALTFCRQAALLEPNLAQPYAEALAYAELGKDSQGMEWAVGKLLSQDWPTENQLLHLKAQSKLESLSDLLRQEKRGSEADKLHTALEKLRARDLVIKLTWRDGSSGPADLDLVIKEPCGSVCSLEQRQTPGGGILVGNTLTEANQATYLASQAFSGVYEITVRRNWGQAFGNRAKLEIIQNFGTARASQRMEIIDLDKQPTIKVAVKDGRRTALAVVPPPASKHAESKEEAPQTSVYQKLRDRAFPNYTGAKAIRGSAWTSGARLPSSQSKVRKQPEHMVYQTGITPQAGGVGLNAQAVMSADQNFLRVSVHPVFQTVVQNPRATVNLPLIPGGSTP